MIAEASAMIRIFIRIYRFLLLLIFFSHSVVFFLSSRAYKTLQKSRFIDPKNVKLFDPRSVRPSNVYIKKEKKMERCD